jgi:eukaryotic-like serine/threonine-protein kinase
MTANQGASTTMMWLKQFTTDTFSRVNQGIDRVDFIRRNKKGLALVLALYCVVVVAGCLGLKAAAQDQSGAFLNKGAAAVERLADQSSNPLLEDDVLGLIRLVSEFQKEHQALFAAVLNHENKVVAHATSDKLNQEYSINPGKAESQSIGQVLVSMGRSSNGVDELTFARTITYSKIKIGSAVYGVPVQEYAGIINRYRFYQLLLVALATLMLGGAFLLMNLRRPKQSVKSMPVSADGAHIGPYHLKDKIAQGGMAELYLADYIRDDGFRRTVAVKKVLPHLAENQDFINMFIREARLAALLQHPNIVQIFDFGKIQNTYFIAMEYIDGLTLGQVMARLKKGLPLDMAVFLITKICLGLDYSHKRKNDDNGQPLGIVHRDISPQNILVSYQGEVKISDFGISKANTEPSLTRAGVIKGKLAYLSPEQALGQSADHRADIYALGLIFYEILTGSRTCQFDSEIEAIRTIPEMVIPPLKEVRGDIPDLLDAIVMKCLAKDKRQRYQDAKAVRDDLVKFKNNARLSYDASDLSNFLRTTFNHESD